MQNASASNLSLFPDPSSLLLCRTHPHLICPPSKDEALLPPPPLRTVHARFQAHGSSLSNALFQGRGTALSEITGLLYLHNSCLIPTHDLVGGAYPAFLPFGFVGGSPGSSRYRHWQLPPSSSCQTVLCETPEAGECAPRSGSSAEGRAFGARFRVR